MNRNGEQLVPHPVSKRWKSHWQDEPVHHNVNADPVQHTRHNRMNRQKFEFPAGRVKNRYNHKRNEKMERQTEPSRYQSAFEGLRAQQSAAIPCNPRRAPTPRCHQITNAEEMSKTPTIKPAVRIARKAPDFFMRFRRSLPGNRKSEAETIAATMDQLMQICNLRCNGREATARLSNL